ncbi:hypothetical protein JCM6882_001877 [Rhodosporidiobolus microsporus]
MASFSFPPPRGGRGRPQPQRTTSAGSRASPYQRPSSSSSTPTTPTDKWQHDLFGDKSDVYNPSLNSGALKSKLRGWNDDTPSASLRPFGASTPAAQPLHSAVQQPQQQQATNGAARPGAQPQIGIKGRSDQAAERRRQQEARAQAERERKELLELRKKQNKEREEKVKVAKEEEMGFVVQVEGLVSGTSAEDVQTAFGAHGDIRFCYIVDPSSAILIARLTFTKHDDAATACSKLDGAVADGRPLRVKQVSRTPMPPPLPALPKVLNSPVAVPAGPRGLAGVPTGPRGRQAKKVAAAPAPPPIPSKMYADEVEAAQLRAGGDSMDVDMAPASAAAVPTGPRRGRGRGGVVPAAVTFTPPAKPGPPPSLAQRVGVATAPKGPAAGRQQQQQAGPQSLAARLGVAQNGGDGAGAGGKGKGGKGKGGPAAGAVQGKSLLARLG